MSTYLMEDPIEAERLEIKTKRDQILKELECLHLEPGQRVLDVGCGTGAVTRIIAEKIFPGPIVGIDFSTQRLGAANHIHEKEGRGNIRFVCSDLLFPSLKNELFDLAYSRCTFQYLSGARGRQALQRMKDLVRPGGRVVVADVDGVGLYRSPQDAIREQALELLVREFEPMGFDAYVGRKLYGMFVAEGFKDIRVDLLPYYLVAGKADPATVRVWEMKGEILKEQLVRILGSEDRAAEVIDRYLEDFQREDVLLFNLIFIVQGTP